MRLVLAFLVLMLCIKFTFSQTVGDIDIKYGNRIDVYSVSEHIWMTPEYSMDGQVCRVRLYPKRIDGNTDYLSKELPFDELQEVLRQLVPVEKRGSKKQSFGVTATGGPAAWTTYPYEKLTFIFVSAFARSTLVDYAPLTKGDFVFSKPNNSDIADSENATASDDDFLPSRASGTEIVTIVWNDRKCSGK